jgi:hypothetical protein
LLWALWALSCAADVPVRPSCEVWVVGAQQTRQVAEIYPCANAQAAITRAIDMQRGEVDGEWWARAFWELSDGRQYGAWETR